MAHKSVRWKLIHSKTKWNKNGKVAIENWQKELKMAKT